MGDEEDRKRLEQMTQKEREKIIFERLERRDMLKTRFDIEQKLKRKQKGEASKKQKVSKPKPAAPLLNLCLRLSLPMRMLPQLAVERGRLP
ncbi:hypothetical protein EB796_018347 [Bugula neritina]|uniref:Uncharacterized protein n=1 Tax=Bugula neritina TaxID=10212 RepID=A0A7J7JBN9_BUGNE|nr:hypothetical protein EB796_018347 [Bugula neritina]